MKRLGALHRKRKFLIALAALCMTFILAIVKIVDGGDWVMSVSFIVGLYSGAEAAEGFAHDEGSSA